MNHPAIICIFLLFSCLLGSALNGPALARSISQSSEAADSADASIADSALADSIEGNEKAAPPTILKMLFGGNLLGMAIVFLILLLSVISLFVISDNLWRITSSKLIPDKVLSELEARIMHGDITPAMEMCRQKANYSMSTEIILAGLQRFQSSEFGYAEYRSAVEEAGEDVTGRLYRRIEVLNVIGAIAPMLGLTGTVIGMIEAFTTIASLEGMARPQELAGGIGQALITTLLGLLVAIPTMVAYSYFRNRIDSIVAEAGKRIEQVMMPLGRKKPGDTSGRKKSK
ncbi:MotA/TolQ/ExbB proton channel family protein [Mariniblastus fucicola]|uniref:Biopolymer transport protein ExbB n=1 Tax=Mariniblastus fucicola TaxID=980251 RepID=A0A5B9P609_9BACT|nr:MotA/TolQ/ExbB proton channel family protein [Mariniblastus fucicola]QEG20360.1 Biopolymer transport protein ExbB [Mariniblastus fucicola]